MKDLMLKDVLIISTILSSTIPYLPQVPYFLQYLIPATLLLTTGIVLGVTREISVEKYSLLIYVLLAMVILSNFIFTTLQTGFSATSTTKAIGYVLFLFIAYFILSRSFLIHSRSIWPALSLCLTVVTGIGVVSGLFGELELFLLQTRNTHWDIPGVGIPAISSVFVDENYFSLLAFVGFLGGAYSFEINQKRWKKSFWLLVCTVNLAALVLSYSRSAYVATFLAVVVWKFGKRVRLASRILSGAVFITGLLLVLISRGSPDRIQTFFQISHGLTGREELWSAAVRLILSRPLSGWGLGRSGEHLLEYTKWSSTHNTLLDFSLMTGLPGGLLLLSLIALSFRSIFFVVQDSKEGRFVAATLVGLFIMNQFLTFTPGGTSFGSLVFAIVLGMTNHVRATAGGNVTRE